MTGKMHTVIQLKTTTVSTGKKIALISTNKYLTNSAWLTVILKSTATCSFSTLLLSTTIEACISQCHAEEFLSRERRIRDLPKG